MWMEQTSNYFAYRFVNAVIEAAGRGSGLPAFVPEILGINRSPRIFFKKKVIPLFFLTFLELRRFPEFFLRLLLFCRNSFFFLVFCVSRYFYNSSASQ